AVGAMHASPCCHRRSITNQIDPTRQGDAPQGGGCGEAARVLHRPYGCFEACAGTGARASSPAPARASACVDCGAP
ncbi:MAG: hypothetical protein ACRD3W_01855, partial [Terriglobales bacterium]